MNGSSASPALERNHAPATPPITPGMARWKKSDLSTFLSLIWERPDASVVGTSATWTTALASAEGSPATVLRNVRQLTP